MCFAYWITKVKNTRLEYEILIVFPLQKWLQERTSILSYTVHTLPVVFKVRIFRSIYMLLDIYFQPVARDNRFMLYYTVVSLLLNILSKY